MTRSRDFHGLPPATVGHDQLRALLALEWLGGAVLARVFPSKQMLDRDAVWAEWNVPPHD